MFCVKGASLSLGLFLKEEVRWDATRHPVVFVCVCVCANKRDRRCKRGGKKTWELSPPKYHEVKKRKPTITNVIHPHTEQQTDVYVWMFGFKPCVCVCVTGVCLISGICNSEINKHLSEPVAFFFPLIMAVSTQQNGTHNIRKQAIYVGC